MRAFILIVVTGLSHAAFARPYRTGMLPSDASPTQSSPLPSTRIHETPPTVRDALRATELDQGEPGNGIYHVLESQYRGKQTRTRGSGEEKREEYGAYHELNGRTIPETPTITDASTSFQPSSETHTPAHSLNLVPHWSYKKHSIAAACIFTGVVVIALAVLMVLYFKKVKRFFERRRRERKSYSAPDYSTVANHGDGMVSNVNLNQDSKNQDNKSNESRDPWSFEISRPSAPSPPAIVVDEDQSLDPTPKADDNGDSSSALPCPPRASYAQGKVVVSHPEPQTPCKLRDSVQKPVIVVPLGHVASMTASMSYATEWSRTPESGSQNDSQEHSQEGSTSDGSSGSRSRHSDPGPDPKRMSLLPRIHRSSSPLFSFDD